MSTCVISLWTQLDWHGNDDRLVTTSWEAAASCSLQMTHTDQSNAGRVCVLPLFSCAALWALPPSTFLQDHCPCHLAVNRVQSQDGCLNKIHLLNCGCFSVRLWASCNQEPLYSELNAWYIRDLWVWFLRILAKSRRLVYRYVLKHWLFLPDLYSQHLVSS